MIKTKYETTIDDTFSMRCEFCGQSTRIDIKVIEKVNTSGEVEERTIKFKKNDYKKNCCNGCYNTFEVE